MEKVSIDVPFEMFKWDCECGGTFAVINFINKYSWGWSWGNWGNPDSPPHCPHCGVKLAPGNAQQQDQADSDNQLDNDAFKEAYLNRMGG